MVVAVAGLRAGVGDQLHAEHQLVVQGGLGGVADRPHHRVPARHRERVAVGVVLHQADQLAQLVEVQVGQPLLAGEGQVDGHGVTSSDRLGKKDTSPGTHSQASLRELARSAHPDADRMRLLSCTSRHMATELDALDVDLLAALREHTRVGVLELSRTLQVARGTVQARLDRLERPGSSPDTARRSTSPPPATECRRSSRWRSPRARSTRSPPSSTRSPRYWRPTSPPGRPT